MSWTPNPGKHGAIESRLRGEFGPVDPAVDGTFYMSEGGT